MTSASDAELVAGSDSTRGACSRSADLVWRIAIGVAFLLFWEWAGRTYGHNWTSLPSLIFARLLVWASGDLYWQIAVTGTEIVIGLALGITSGVLAGLWLGQKQNLARVLRPYIIMFYSVPLIAIVPLLILWFGIGLMPKIVLITHVVFWILFFNTFSGVQQVDPDLIASMDLMGASGREKFVKLVAPASMAWVMTGLKIALPYSLVAAITGEMLAARVGIGHLVSSSADQFDMTGLFAALFIVMLVGILVSFVANALERHLLRWRGYEE